MIANINGLSLRRIWLIARRDYLGYIKTWGFWLSFLMPVVFGALGFIAASSDLTFSPPRYETVLDLSGAGIGEAMLDDHFERMAEVREQLEAAVPESMRGGMSDAVDREEGDLVFIEPPARTVEGLQPFLRGERMAEHLGEDVQLSGALVIDEQGGEARTRYWSENVNAGRVPSIARRWFRDQARADYLEAGGLSLDGYREASAVDTTIETLDPTRAEGVDQLVTRADKIPFYVAALAAAFLWFTVFSGAYMLLTSMLEEKLGKLLEMTLATTQFAELMMGKLLGIALLTVTAIAPYILLIVVGVAGFAVAEPEVAAGLRQALSLKMVVFFPVFLLLGYVFYGSLFIALGSLSESMQDAQTITIPLMIVLTACVLVVPAGLSNPNAPVVQFASWFPLSAPFAAIVRLPTDPSWASLLGTALLLLGSTVAVGWLATKVFRHGVLSGGGVRGLFGGLSARARSLRRPAPRADAG